MHPGSQPAAKAAETLRILCGSLRRDEGTEQIDSPAACSHPQKVAGSRQSGSAYKLREWVDECGHLCTGNIKSFHDAAKVNAKNAS